MGLLFFSSRYSFSPIYTIDARVHVFVDSVRIEQYRREGEKRTAAAAAEYAKKRTRHHPRSFTRERKAQYTMQEMSREQICQQTFILSHRD